MQIQSELGQTGYGYDPLNRLSKAEPDQALQDKGLPNEAYSWDAAGNRLSSAHQAGAWTYNEANQLLQYPRALDENAPAQQSQTEQVSASYNALGHLIKETGADWERNWRYNAAGRLSEIKDNADGLTVQYRYDPFGRRIAKTVTQGATSRTTYYINGESALMAEADEEGRITRAYGFNPHTQQARTNEEDEDAQEGSLWSTDPIWQADLAADQSLKEASYHYLVTDHLGAPVLALNKAGETTWKARYEAFGKARIDNASTAQINLRLPGQYFDAETGLHQNWNRDYAPGIGRYVQADPLGIFGGMNVYQYAYGNPIYYIDDSGNIVPLILGAVPIMSGAIGGYIFDYAIQNIRSRYCTCHSGYPKTSTVIGGIIGGTGPFATKPRGGIAGGGRAGNKTSVFSQINHFFSDPERVSGFRYSVATRHSITRGLRVMPVVGTVMFAGYLLYGIYDISTCTK